MYVFRNRILLLFIFLHALLLPGVASAESVTLQLKWTHQFQFAGYYAAIEKGFYQEEGLEVTLRKAKPKMSIENEVVTGHAEFGIDNTSLLIARDKGAPIKVIAAIFQHSPQVLLAGKNSGIVSPHDLAGKKLMLVPEQSTDILAMLSMEGIDIQQVQVVPHSWHPADIADGNADAMTGYITAEPYMLKEKNIPFTIINPINYGIDYYGDCLFTSEQLIETNPDLVRRFLKASLRGWEYALSHQDEIIDVILAKYNPSLTRENLQYEAAELNKIILPQYVELGHMNPGRWSKIVETHQKFGLLKPDFSVKQLLYDPNSANINYRYAGLILPLLTLIGLLAFSLAAFIIFNKNLRRIVKERTEKLEEKIAQLEETEATILHLAYYDVLTNLPNRLKLTEQLSEMIETDPPSDSGFAVAFIDLDDFKRINDAMGHSAGDELLKVIAGRLQNALGLDGFAYRLGGDEFILLLRNVSSRDKIEELAEHIITNINSPWTFNDNDFHISASIGIAIYPDAGNDAGSLIKAADMAMYEAKQHGKNRFHFFSAEMHAASLIRLTLESDLHKALANSEFFLHYQPQVDYNSRIIGAEALIRWNHPTKGLLSPGTFIPLAEETGLIVPIGDWIIRTACRQCMEWQAICPEPIRISINISVKQLLQPYFLAKIRSALTETGLPPHLLELEITETIAVNHAEAVFPIMKSLRALGVRFALDDFGTGYSSLMYLKNFPIDVLKIDKTFIPDAATTTDNLAIIEAICSLAKNLHIEAVAEGVETLDQYSILRNFDCPIMQGYLFSPPVPAQQLYQLLQRQYLPPHSAS